MHSCRVAQIRPMRSQIRKALFGVRVVSFLVLKTSHVGGWDCCSPSQNKKKSRTYNSAPPTEPIWTMAETFPLMLVCSTSSYDS